MRRDRSPCRDPLDARIRSYIDTRKPSVGLYVRKGASLPDFADPKEWVFDGTAAEELLHPSVVEGVEANGHAFRDMD